LKIVLKFGEWLQCNTLYVLSSSLVCHPERSEGPMYFTRVESGVARNTRIAIVCTLAAAMDFICPPLAMGQPLRFGLAINICQGLGLMR
jgi:hypothetical protein